MSASDLLSSLADRLGTVTADSVYGDPVERGDRTVVPVAKIAYGFGAGAGGDGDDEGGGGAGVAAKPVGALEITDGDTTFVRFGTRKRYAAAAVAGLVVGYLLGRR